MNTIFRRCLQVEEHVEEMNPENSRVETIHEKPLKYKLASALKIVDLGLRLYVEPRNK